MELQPAPTCPKCGADAPDAKVGESYTCPFCMAVSVAAAPARAVPQVVVQREVIQRVVMVEPVTGKTSLPCPRCDVPLFEGTAVDTTLHGCGTCGGVWLDNAASSRVVQSNQPPILAMSDRAAGARRAPIDETAPARCPLDRSALARKTVHGIEVDACATHGTWFDAGEVRRVAAAFNGRRFAAVGGATHDYSAAAAEAQSNQRYAEGAMTIFGLLLAGAAGAVRTSD